VDGEGEFVGHVSSCESIIRCLSLVARARRDETDQG
jgi:hypothetical protein